MSGALSPASGVAGCTPSASGATPPSTGLPATTVPTIIGDEHAAELPGAAGGAPSGLCSSLAHLGVAVAAVEGVDGAVDQTVSNVASRAGCAEGTGTSRAPHDAESSGTTAKAAASANPLCSVLTALAAGLAQAPVVGAEVQGAIGQLESGLGCNGSGGTGSNPLCSALTQVGSGISQIPSLGSQLDTLVTEVASGLGCSASSATSPSTPPAVAAAGSSSAPPANAVTAPANFTG